MGSKKVPDSLTFYLPEPPSLNRMLQFAKKRAKRGRKWLPLYYLKQQEYRDECAYAIRHMKKPRRPWSKWAVTALHFRLHGKRDPLDLMAGTKWPIDFLVDNDFLEDDSERHVVEFCLPTQEIDRKDRGMTITIERRDKPHECGEDHEGS